MRNFLLSSLLILAAVPTLAQQNGDNSGVRVGLGTGLFFETQGKAYLTGTLPAESSIEFIPVTAVSFFVPIEFSGFTLEPEVGMYNYSYAITDGPEQTQNVSSTSIRIGTGIFYTNRVTPNFKMYVGPRLGIVTHSMDNNQFDSLATPQTQDISASRTDFFAGLSVGGEYFLSANFSLGVEAELEYLNMGTETMTMTLANNGSQQTSSGHTLTTKAGIVARVFF